MSTNSLCCCAQNTERVISRKEKAERKKSWDVQGYFMWWWRWFLLFGNLVHMYRCQGYIKARMKSEEKRRTRFHSGHGSVYHFYCLCLFFVFFYSVFAFDFSMGFHTGGLQCLNKFHTPTSSVQSCIVQSCTESHFSMSGVYVIID